MSLDSVNYWPLLLEIGAHSHYVTICYSTTDAAVFLPFVSGADYFYAGYVGLR
jgi:hypothetical protein